MNASTLVVDLSMRSGGTQRRVLDLAASVGPEQMWRVAHLGGSELGAQLAHGSVPRTALDRRRWDPRLVVDLVRLLRAEGIHVLDAHNVTAQLWGPLAARLARTPRVVCTVHSDYAAEHASRRRGSWYVRVLWLAELLGAEFVAVSATVSTALERAGIAAGHITTIPNALPSRPHGGRHRTEMRAALGIGATSFVVACTARLEPVKQVVVLVDALDALVRCGIDAHLVVVGDGSQRRALADHAESLGMKPRVHLLGTRDDVFDVLGAADCFCLVSTSEGLPYAPLEATLAGLPLVLTRVGALPEVLGEDGAIFVPVGDPRAVTSALADLASSSRRRASLASVAGARTAAALPREGLVRSTRAVHDLRPPLVPVTRRLAGRLAATPTADTCLGLMGRVSRRALSKPGTLHVLGYHRVAPQTTDSTLDPTLLSATPRAFDAQMRFLRRELVPVDIDTVLGALRGEVDLPPGAVHVTFDDGYRDVAVHAAPVLRRHGIPATLFVPTSYPDAADVDFWWDRLHRALANSSLAVLATPAGTYPLDGRLTSVARATAAIAAHVKSRPHVEAMALIDEIVEAAGGTERMNAVLGWDRLAELGASGITVAPHSRSHAALDRIPAAQLSEEVCGSLRDVEDRLGSSPPVFAYPTGQTSPDVLAALRCAGYAAAFTTESGPNRLPIASPLLLRRIDVYRRITVNRLASLLSPAAAVAGRFL
jgi:glycosyltransferase involved in cell wall biosynthesis/peptidoglycan/xylan/chitin deacetylase (PgdA/CDA1 family)